MVLVPQSARRRAIQSAAYAWELRLSRFDVAGAERFEHILDTVTDNGTSRTVTIATNDVLSLSFLSACNSWHS